MCITCNIIKLFIKRIFWHIINICLFCWPRNIFYSILCQFLFIFNQYNLHSFLLYRCCNYTNVPNEAPPASTSEEPGSSAWGSLCVAALSGCRMVVRSCAETSLGLMLLGLISPHPVGSLDLWGSALHIVSEDNDLSGFSGSHAQFSAWSSTQWRSSKQTLY